MRLRAAIFFCWAFFLRPSTPQSAPIHHAPAAAAEFSYRVINTYPHDTSAFTEGLEYRDGFVYESTGIKGQSTLRKVALETGQVVQQIHLNDAYFGEGITVLNGRIMQMTWLTQIGFVYNQNDFSLIRTFAYPGEGWGMTNDGQNIYMSDGTDQIRVWDPNTMQERRRIPVLDGGQPVIYLNELEWVNGEILANVWQTNRIARIDPGSGRVTGWIDLTGILSPAESAGADVLNGIAYDAAQRRLFVTGKYWPKLFEIRLTRKNARPSPLGS